jgi:hypothetical protein
VTSYWWRFVTETSPGVTLLLVGLLAAAPAYSLLRRSARGRARGAIAYLAGLATGVASMVAAAALLQPVVRTAIIVEAGLLSAFFGPFAGMLCAKWQKPTRKKRTPARLSCR